jgi:hypothetical protein
MIILYILGAVIWVGMGIWSVWQVAKDKEYIDCLDIFMFFISIIFAPIFLFAYLFLYKEYSFRINLKK